MSKKNPLSTYERKLNNLAIQFEHAFTQKKPIYLEADEFVDLADWYQSNGEEDLSDKALETGLKIHPKNDILLIEKANVFLDRNLYEAAVEIYKSISNKNSSDSKILGARLFIYDNLIDEAFEILNSQEGEELDEISAAYMLGAAGYASEAITRLENYRSKLSSEENESYLAVLADSLFTLERIEESEETFKKLVDIDPYSSPYWYGLGRCYFLQGNYNKAIDAFDYGIISDEDFGECYVIRAASYLMLGNTEQALDDLKRATIHRVEGDNVIYDLAIEHLYNQKKWPEIIPLLKNRINTQVDFENKAANLILLANCLLNINPKANVYSYLDEAERISPENIETHLLKVRLFLEKNDEYNATLQLNLALDKSQNWEICYQVGYHLLDTGFMEYSLKAFEQIFLLYPTAPYIKEILSLIYLITEKFEKFGFLNSQCTNPLSVDLVEQYKTVISKGNNQDKMIILNRLLSPYRNY